MTKTFQANTGLETNSYDSHRLSPAYALIVKPFDNRLSLYANYIEGLSQGLHVTNPLATNFNESFPPFVSKQIETGAKLDLGVLANTLSFYEITQPTLSTVTSGGLHQLQACPAAQPGHRVERLRRADPGRPRAGRRHLYDRRHHAERERKDRPEKTPSAYQDGRRTSMANGTFPIWSG